MMNTPGAGYNAETSVVVLLIGFEIFSDLFRLFASIGIAELL